MCIKNRIFAILLCVAMLVSLLCACNKPSTEETSTPSPTEATTPLQTTPTTTTPEDVVVIDPPTTPAQHITSVHITSGDSEMEAFVATELKWYFAQKNVTISPDGFGIDVKIDNRLAKTDGYRITSDTDGVHIVGNNERGLAYALYAFLENYLGVHFYSADTIVVDEGDVMIGGGVLGEYEPAFNIIRNPWYPIEKLAEKNGGNVHDLGTTKTLNLNAIVGSGSIQPCLSDPESLTKATTVVKNYLRAVSTDTLSFAPASEYDLYCTCENCSVIHEEEGSPAGIYVRFLNELTKIISADYPNLQYEIVIRAYLKTAPSVTKLADNISVRFNMDKCHISHPVTDTTCPDAVAFANSMRSWGAMGANISIEYGITATKDFIPVFANLGSLRENMRFFAECGVDNIVCDGNIICPTGEFGELRVYLISQLLQNPMMSEEEYYAYMDSFLEDYYGAGWTYIRQFIDKIIELASDGHQIAAGSPFDAITEAEYLENEATFDEWWNQAEALAGDRLDFVKRARFQWRYIKLCLHPNAEDAQSLIADAASNPRVGWREKQWNVDTAKSNLDLAPTEWTYKS